MQVLIINFAADLQRSHTKGASSASLSRRFTHTHTLQHEPHSVCVCVCVSGPFITASLSFYLPQKLQTSVTQEKIKIKKPTNSSALSLCDWLRLLPKQIGLANHRPLNHPSSGQRQMKSKAGDVFIQRPSSRSTCEGLRGAK